MSIKKKLGLGMASAALGLSLIGGGTFAYFSDEATVHNSIAAGTLKFNVGTVAGHDFNFDLSNFRPGDSVQRAFKLTNTGSLAIEKVLMKVVDASVKKADNTAADAALTEKFLKSLTLNAFIQNYDESGYVQGPQYHITSGTITLWDALYGDISGNILNGYYDNTQQKINLTPNGIDSDGTGNGKYDGYVIRINFPEANVAQNDLQGLKATFDFHLDARQVMGDKVHGSWGPNGKITGNQIQGTKNLNGELQNAGVFKTDGNKTITNPVTRPNGFQR
ncbi:TasA family protein [Bacillus sp. FJAT-27445]|uniref:TasA family protein n=1 Tax=Bacillus sp. FJAT-27445 TaxID=1679166 RepID=UPI0007433B6A|nr:TasA family protein [Bacillus sp. FJAT-27445]